MSGAWLVETVAIGDAEDIDIAVGASGTPQVVWVDGIVGGGYAYRNTTAQWVSDPGLSIGGSAVAIAVDPSTEGPDEERPIVATRSSNTQAGIWARQRLGPSDWFAAQLDATFSPATATTIDLAYASDGTLHGAYTTFALQLVHGRLDPGATPSTETWNSEIIDTTAGSTMVAIATGDDSVHIAYAGGSQLRYARAEGFGAFGLEIIDASVSASAPSLALTADDTAVVSYYDQDEDQLWYAADDDGWTPSLVDGLANDAGRRSGLGVTPDGEVAVAYWDVSGLDVESALRSSVTAGPWGLDTVDFSDAVGGRLSATMDAAGGLHVAYLKASPNPNEIRYAYRCP